MDKNTITGLVLIGVLLVGFSFLSRPNEEQIAAQKKYYRHSGYPGGLKEESFERAMERHPERVIEHAVKGMLPKNTLGRAQGMKLKVYAGPEHPHTQGTAQNPDVSWV